MCVEKNGMSGKNIAKLGQVIPNWYNFGSCTLIICISKIDYVQWVASVKKGLVTWCGYYMLTKFVTQCVRGNILYVCQ